MKVGHIELFCQDTAAVKEFYCRYLGCELEQEQEGGFVWLKSGAIEILLRPVSAGGSMEEPLSGYGQTIGSALVFYTDGVAAKEAELDELELEKSFDGGDKQCPLYRDPDGRWIQIVDPGQHSS